MAKLTKSEIKQICIKNGVNICGNFTIASKNKALRNNDIYWANPNVDFLDVDWYFVLNDYHNRILYCFTIKANSISKNQIKTRILNNRNLMDLQIKHNNSCFVDIRSKINFLIFLVKTINY